MIAILALLSLQAMAQSTPSGGTEAAAIANLTQRLSALRVFPYTSISLAEGFTLPTDALNICTSSASSGGNALSNSNVSCSAGPAENIIFAPIAPATCAVLALQGFNDSVDSDLIIGDFHELTGSSFSAAQLCNDGTEPMAMPALATRNFGDAAAEPIVITRLDTESSHIVRSAAAAPHRASSVVQRDATAEEIAAGLTAFTARFSSEGILENQKLSQLNLTGLNVSQIKICNADMGASGTAPGTSMVISARDSVTNGCSAADAAAVTADIAPQSCALFALQSLSSGAEDIDLGLVGPVVGESAGLADAEGREVYLNFDNALDDHPIAFYCNQTALPQPIRLVGERLLNPVRQGLVARIAVTPGPNGDGLVTTDQLRNRMTAQILSLTPEALNTMRTHITTGLTVITRFAGLTAATRRTQAFCWADFMRGREFTNDAGANDMSYPELAVRTRTGSGDNTCNEARRQELVPTVTREERRGSRPARDVTTNPTILVNQCTVIVAQALDPASDIDIAFNFGDQNLDGIRSTNLRGVDDSGASVAYIYVCNTTNHNLTFSLEGRYWNPNPYNRYAPALITRVSFPVANLASPPARQ